MNYFTEKSIELATQRNYLDLLYSVYPLVPDSVRNIDPRRWSAIEENFTNGNNVELLRALLNLDLFPIKDGYVPYFRRDRGAIERNPRTVNRICGRVRELGLDALYERCSQPKETNRQMGPLFSRWVKSGVLGLVPVSKEEFDANMNDAILDGSDTALKEYARQNLGFTRNKGVDFLARFNGQHIIGEAKFISDEGGHQNDQFLDAMTTIETTTNENVRLIAILDGVLYILSRKKMYTQITSHDLPVMSALLLREYLYSL